MKRTKPAPTIQRFNTVVPYVTKDGATVRELMHPALHGNAAQSLTEARISKGKRTLLHRHLKSEELCHVIGGRGEITLGDECFAIKTGDTVCIPPGTPHRVQALGPTSLRILCCCSPACSHEDTELLETVGEEEETKGEVREALVTEPAIQRDSATRNYWELRERIGLNQSKFWAAVRVTQSGGSRYENDRAAPQQVDILVRLAYGDEQDAADLLASLRKALPSNYRPKKSIKTSLESGESLKELRKRMLLNQSDFWGLVRVTQSGASRYELGRSIPPSTKLLLQLVLCTDEQAASLMQELRRRD